MAKAVKPYEKRLRVRGRLSFNPRLTIHFKWLTILCRGCKLLGKFVPKQVQVCWNRECHAGFSQPQGNVKDVVVATLVPQVSGRWVDYVAGLIQSEIGNQLKTGPCSTKILIKSHAKTRDACKEGPGDSPRRKGPFWHEQNTAEDGCASSQVC